MVVAPFGFSVGDFLAGVELVGKAAKALREVNGATRQFQQASVDLAALDDILRKVQRLEPRGSDVDIVHTIHFCAHSCHVPLKQFLCELKKLEPFLQLSARPPKRSSWNRGFKKVDWAIRLEKEVTKLKASISPQLASISLLLGLESLNRTSLAQATLDRSLTSAQDLLNKVEYINTWMSSELATRTQLSTYCNRTQDVVAQHARRISTVGATTETIQHSTKYIAQRLDALEYILRQGSNGTGRAPSLPPTTFRISATFSTTIPVDQMGRLQDQLISLCQVMFRAIRIQLAATVMALCTLMLGHTLRVWGMLSRGPTMILDTDIHLEDALGRTFSFQFEHFRHWPLVQARLELAFVGLPGEDQIKKGHFHLEFLGTKERHVMTWKVWEASVSPGCRLVMSIEVRQRLLHSKMCPGCYQPVSTPHERCQIHCDSCGLTYEVMKSDRKSRDLKSMLEEALQHRIPPPIKDQSAYSIVWNSSRDNRGRPKSKRPHHQSHTVPWQRRREEPVQTPKSNSRAARRAGGLPQEEKHLKASDIGRLRRVHAPEPFLADILSKIEDDALQVPWDRREKWAIQIISDLRDIHEAGSVLRDITTSAVLIDVNDTARLVKVGHHGRPSAAWAAPKVMRILDSGQDEGAIPVGVKSDLYQLGLVLWYLLPQPSDVVRSTAGDYDGSFVAETLVPEYFQTIVLRCLSPRPQRRASAEQLLMLVPRALSRRP